MLFRGDGAPTLRRHAKNGGHMEEGGTIALDLGVEAFGNVALLRLQGLVLIAGVCMLLIW